VLHDHTTSDRQAAEVERCTVWLRERIAESLQLPAVDLADEVPLTMYGLDSLLTAVVLADVEDWLGVDLDPSAMPAQPTLRELGRAIADAAVLSAHPHPGPMPSADGGA
jgi:acyl carrier protein